VVGSGGREDSVGFVVGVEGVVGQGARPDGGEGAGNGVGAAGVCGTGWVASDGVGG